MPGTIDFIGVEKEEYDYLYLARVIRDRVTGTVTLQLIDPEEQVEMSYDPPANEFITVRTRVDINNHPPAEYKGADAD